MRNLQHGLAVLLVFAALFLPACLSLPQPVEPAIASSETPLPQPDVPAEPTLTASADVTATAESAPKPFVPGNPLCASFEGESLQLSCDGGVLSVTQAENRRKADDIVFREVAFKSPSVLIEAEVVSIPAEAQPLDQNQYGIFFVDRKDLYHAARISGQYITFETWSLAEDLKIIDRYERVFSPFLNSSGRGNQFRLICAGVSCDLFINEELAGRVPDGLSDRVTRVGLFAAADWDQTFGRVDFNSFNFEEVPSNQPESQTFTLMDDLTTDHGAFTGLGLSGAFSAYPGDGFHFSPVVPYNFYTARTGPSLADVAVEAVIKMEINPGVSGSQFAGLVCRASQEGMITAVLRVDGTYIIFRDTPKKPLAVLARKASEMILPGLSENHMRLVCDGPKIELFINGAKVESLNDARYGLRFGRVGLFTKAGGSPHPDAVVFSDLKITELRGQ